MMAKTDYQNRLIYLLFFLSGISGLIYQTVWLRILIRTLGVTVYATSTILAAFMAGLALGSYFFGKYADRTKRLLRLYAILELGIGISAIVTLFVFGQLVPVFRFIFDLTGGNYTAMTLVRVIILFICLLIPTFLMGGTLPVLSAHTRRYRTAFAIRVGHLYGLNTLGAMLGVFGSGLFFIGSIGELKTILIGVVINLGVALIAFSLDAGSEKLKPTVSPTQTKPTEKGPKSVIISPYVSSIRKIVIIAYFLNGFVALAYEVVWTRMFQLHLGTSIYAFSMMLGVYLSGIALGSIWGGKYVNKIEDPLRLFAFLQVFIAFYSILGLYLFTVFKPVSTQIALFNILLVPLVLVLPITVALGLIFPAVSRSYVAEERVVGAGVGRLYAMNTFGCILGSLVCGFVLIYILGTKGTILFLAGVNAVIGIWLMLIHLPRIKKRRFLVPAYGLLTVTIALALFSPDPFFSVLKREIHKKLGDDMEIYYHKESVTATTTAFGSKTKPLTKYLWINGVGMTFLCTETKLMAHLPILLSQDPKDVLVVCFGMGTTLRSARVHQNLQVDVVELIPETYECYRFFHQDGPKVLADPRVRYFVDDGRNFLLMRDKKYDVITMDPSPPLWSAGTVNLYSQEFLKLCRSRLKSFGIMCLWVPPHALTEVLMIMRTFQSVFPHTSVWKGIRYPGFYLIGTTNPLSISTERFDEAFQNKDFLVDLWEWDRSVPNADSLMNLLLLNESQLSQFVRGVPIITDDHPYTEFPLWRQHFNPYGRYKINAVLVESWKKR